MPEAGIPLRPLIAATAAFSAPTLVVLLAFAIYESIPLGHVLPVWIVLSAVALALLHRRHRALEIMRRHVEKADSARSDVRLGDVRLPALGEPALGALAGAIDRIVRQTRGESALVGTSIRARDVVIDAVPQPLLLLGRDGLVVGANEASRKLLGAELAGRALAEILRHPLVLETAQEVLEGGGGRAVEVTLGLPADRVFSVRVDPLPMAGPAGAVALLMLTDMTAIKRAERMRADFIANVSHELRTPLASIVGFIETLAGAARDDAAARERFLEIMNQQAQRMARLVADLLSLSRIEQNEHLPPTGRVDLAQMLGAVKATLDMVAQNKAMSIALDIPDDLPPVLGEADELQQVFQNLIDNAIKYGRTGTAVTVTIRLTSDPPPAFPRPALSRSIAGPTRAVSVAVTDRGAGIAREHLPRLTERFYRVSVARSREAGGTGLGLAIVKHILNRHRGVLTIESSEGQGSTFTVHLPEYPRT